MAKSARAASRAHAPPQRARARWGLASLAAIGIAATPVRPALAADSAQIQRAIDRGRAFLFAQQKDGNWELVQARDPAESSAYSVKNGQWGGRTALVTLALLACGVDANDPHIQRAVAFLRKAEIKGHYALGLRAQVWGLLPPEPWTREAELADMQMLSRGILTGRDAGPAAGIYGYAAGRPVDEADHSVSQFAVLGMWALAQAGVEIPTAYWQLVDQAWHRHQLASGAWGYRVAFPPRPKPVDPKATVDPRKPPAKLEPTVIPPTVSMTAAGAATLFITQEYLQLVPKCNGNIDDPAIDAGLRYLGEHLTELVAGREYYTLFGISRVGLASGYKYLGATDWFKWGSDKACRDQAANGGWTLYETENENDTGVPSTSFALLFLARGRAPIMMNKLRYDVTAGTGKKAKAVPGTWDQRPRDVANLSRWVGRQIESQLNWQVVTLDQSANDLHDAPILYLAGSKAPKLSDADVARLRTYVEDGGLVLGHADCASADFAKGFRALGEQMFPTCKFRPLEMTSPILSNELFPATSWKSGKPSVEALSNGARELMVLLPTGDPARQWQGQVFRSAKTDVPGQLMIDLFLYAVDKEGLRRRGETYLVARNQKHGKATPPAIRVARLKYAGNWDPEPGGWRRLSNVLHNDGSAELTTEPVAGPIAKSFAVASLTICAADAKLTDAERSAIRDYVNGGGTLLVDVAGGRGLYRTAAEAEIARIFPDAPRDLPVIPADSPVYTGGKAPVGPVDFRRFQRPGNGHVPLVRGYTLNGRVAVLYSPEDLSTGLVGEPVDGVDGYVPASATAVAGHLLLYAAR